MSGVCVVCVWRLYGPIAESEMGYLNSTISRLSSPEASIKASGDVFITVFLADGLLANGNIDIMPSGS